MFEISVKENNYEKSISLINSLIKKNELNISIKLAYFVKLLKLLVELNNNLLIYDYLKENKKLIEESKKENYNYYVIFNTYEILADLNQKDIWLANYKLKKLKMDFDNYMIINYRNNNNSQNFDESIEDETKKYIEELEIKINIKKRNSKFVNENFNVINLYGENYKSSLTFKDDTNIDFPIQSNHFTNIKVHQISCGNYHIIALCSFLGSFNKNICKGKELIGWGDNTYQQICQNQYIKTISEPVIIDSGNLNIKKIKCIKSETMILTEENKIFHWGSKCEENEIKEILFEDSIEINDFLMGHDHYYVINNKGDVYFWGELQEKSKIYFKSDKPIKINSKYKVINGKAGKNHSLFWDENKSILCFGLNLYGQISYNKKIILFNEISICNSYEDYEIIDFYTMNNFNLILTKDEGMFINGNYIQKISYFPTNISLPDNEFIKDLVYNDNDLYILSEKGEIYFWEIGIDLRFKKLNNIKNKYQNIYSGKKFLILLDSYIFDYKLKLKNTNFEEWKNNSLYLTLYDNNKQKLLNLPNCSIRVYFILSQIILNKNELSFFIKKKYNFDKNKNINAICSNNNIEAKFLDFKNSTLKFDFFIKDASSKFLYIIINEELKNKYLKININSKDVNNSKLYEDHLVQSNNFINKNLENEKVGKNINFFWNENIDEKSINTDLIIKKDKLSINSSVYNDIEVVKSIDLTDSVKHNDDWVFPKNINIKNYERKSEMSNTGKIYKIKNVKNKNFLNKNRKVNDLKEEDDTTTNDTPIMKPAFTKKNKNLKENSKIGTVFNKNKKDKLPQIKKHNIEKIYGVSKNVKKKK